MTMHVAIAGWLLGPPSGANRRLEALLMHAAPLLQAGERVTLLHRRDHTPAVPPGIHRQPVDVPAGPTWRRVLAERRLDERLRALGANVLDHGFLPLPATRLPSCLLIHDLRAADGFGGWPRALFRWVVRRSCRAAHTVVVPSTWTAQRLQSLVPGLSPVVVPNGVELPPAGLPPPAAVPAGGYLLHVGHLEPRKNLGVVLAALARLPAERRPELWLAGRDAGAGRELQWTANRLGIAAAVRALGVVDDARLARLYAHARAVVVPSRCEGFGLPALEGLAHGADVLAGDAGALPEVLGGLGTLLPVDDAEAWAAAIDALELPVATALRAARRARAAALPWAQTAAGMLGVWRQLGAGSRH